MTTTDVTVTVIDNLPKKPPTCRNQTVSPQSYMGTAAFEDRDREQSRLATLAGLVLPDTRLPPGTALLPIGQEAQARMQRDLYALPPVADMAAALRRRITAEAPKDTDVRLAELRFRPDTGRIYRPSVSDSPGYGLTPEAFADVANLARPEGATGWASTLAALPPKIRAEAWDWAVQRSEDRPLVLRTIRDDPNSPAPARIVRAAVSKRYAVADDADVVAALLDRIPAGGRMRWFRGRSRSQGEVVFPTLTRELRVGDIAQVAVRVRNSETGDGAVVVDAAALRVLCYNFTVAWSTDEGRVNVRHIGDPVKVRRAIGAAVAAALARVEPLIRAFGDAYANPLPASAPTPAELVGRMVRVKALPAHLAADVVAAWDADGEKGAGRTLAGAVNALTRAAQDLTQDQALPLEQLGGRLLAEGWKAVL